MGIERTRTRRVNVKLSDDVYLELIKRYGPRGLSKGVEKLLRAALALPPAGETPKGWGEREVGES